MQSPRLRTVEKYHPPYLLNKFPAHFAVNLGREVVYLLASRSKDARLEGQDWEEIFARLIGAAWKPSNVGLDDIVLEQTAWGAKTVKHAKPSTVSKIRLIENVPEERLAIRIKEPPQLDRDAVLQSIKFDTSWIQLLNQ